MNPTDFPQANTTLKRPANMTEAECSDLRVLRDPATHTILSCWMPTEEERAAIAAGGPIWLFVWSDAHPPVALSGKDPFA